MPRERREPDQSRRSESAQAAQKKARIVFAASQEEQQTLNLPKAFLPPKWVGGLVEGYT